MKVILQWSRVQPSQGDLSTSKHLPTAGWANLGVLWKFPVIMERFQGKSRDKLSQTHGFK